MLPPQDPLGGTMFTLMPTRRVALFERVASNRVVVEAQHGMRPQASASLWDSVLMVLSTMEKTAIHLALYVRVYAVSHFPTVPPTHTVFRRGVLNAHQIRLRHLVQRPLMIVNVMQDTSQRATTALAVPVQPIRLRLRASASLVQMDRSPFLVEAFAVAVEMG